LLSNRRGIERDQQKGDKEREQEGERKEKGKTRRGRVSNHKQKEENGLTVAGSVTTTGGLNRGGGEMLSQFSNRWGLRQL